MTGPETGEEQSRLSDDSRLECRICWYVYDPAEGDPVEQIPPGTPFLELPGHWRCPQCDAEPSAFLPVEG
ncbi:MAG: rubredoxin [Gammaproteobacteria bacterium]|nr:rubredoxin [Gammaproteobacteria bacterium]MDH3757118.1 rubredoxin [Gammaproteobacteria bacterium]MDH3846257.1 rubredoxin [Gammaproteobacteria bacterium]MDH3862750.1 rubredoxin [Gammaproteobacteria bacterium]MDH3904112.1 rubredoxin [Gammaproteobacteria bacterium]